MLESEGEKKGHNYQNGKSNTNE